jgi:flagellar biosynthetic protein FliP
VRAFFLCLILTVGALMLTSTVHAQSSNNDTIRISIDAGKDGGKGTGNLSINIQLLILFTVLSIVPGILIMTTSFVRIVIVLSFLRNALTVQQPSNQVILSLALFLTAFIMAPTWEVINKEAVAPLRAGKINTEQALDKGAAPLKTFMLRFTREKDLRLFMDMSSTEIKAEGPEDLPLQIVIPAFMVSELKTGFQMGLLILLPFVVIDMVVASILMALGMMMLPPPIVALPLKLMVFVLVDGWALIVHSLVLSFK